ncbi:MAG: nucleotidyl transferase AbiEii/AbiGii toxin family protein [Clostridia bacterium]|nr:nucleotidyl transferase AbiEii/AbiGii toxin family protein [Clostridia bacterium]
MLTEMNFSEEHIRKIQNESHRDPGLIERTLFAFGLLEALSKVGLKFIFKSGTSLMLLLPHPMRLSTDIDIVVEPGTDIEKYIRKVRGIFPFRESIEQSRSAKGNIEKRHFKFVYDSPINDGNPLYILLDVLFEENHYDENYQVVLNIAKKCRRIPTELFYGKAFALSPKRRNSLPLWVSHPVSAGCFRKVERIIAWIAGGLSFRLISQAINFTILLRIGTGTDMNNQVFGTVIERIITDACYAVGNCDRG